jgi:hypothetical protein
MAIQFHLIIEFQASLLDGLLDPHPEDPAVIDGVRVSIVEAAVTFLFNPIGPKHRMPFRQLDSAFFHQELKKLVSFGDIEVVRALDLLDPSLVHCKGFLPHIISAAATSSSSSKSSIWSALSRNDYRCLLCRCAWQIWCPS